jgi:Predicted acetyltransferase
MLHIRSEKQEDFDAIHAFVQEAFATSSVSDGKEQDFVRQLRRSKGYIPGIALVAENNGQIAGFIMLSQIFFNPEQGEPQPALLLAPLCVHAACRGRKFGSMLTRAALNKARTLGHKRVFVVGDPAFYARFGFRAAEEFSIENTNGIPTRYLLALELAEGAFEGLGGTVSVL